MDLLNYFPKVQKHVSFHFKLFYYYYPVKYLRKVPQKNIYYYFLKFLT